MTGTGTVEGGMGRSRSAAEDFVLKAGGEGDDSFFFGIFGKEGLRGGVGGCCYEGGADQEGQEGG